MDKSIQLNTPYATVNKFITATHNSKDNLRNVMLNEKKQTAEAYVWYNFTNIVQKTKPNSIV